MKSINKSILKSNHLNFILQYSNVFIYILSIYKMYCRRISYINDQMHCDTIRIRNIDSVQDITNIDNNIVQSIVGFTGDVENAGCTGNVISQENHIIETSGGSISPKNIVFRTTEGSFFRDDTLVNIKGNVRGEGANDLSLIRSECSQVASGDYSSVLGGEYNTSSGVSSIVVGGSFNISGGSNTNILGGISNSVYESNSLIWSGNNNSLASENSIILTGNGNTGSNSLNSGIFTGKSNTFSLGSNQTIISGSNNTVSNSIHSCVYTGESNIINSGLTGSHMIITGISNKNSFANGSQLIVTGTNNSNTGADQSVIIDGCGNGISNSIRSSIITGSSNLIMSRSNNLIGTGFNNISDGSSSGFITGQFNQGSVNAGFIIVNGLSNKVSGVNSVVINGIENNIVSGNSNVSIITGFKNSNSLTSRSNMIIATGISNSSINSGNGIMTGIGNTCTVANPAYSFIGSGSSCTVNGVRSGIVSGNGNSISLTGVTNSSIITGINNIISARTNQFIGTGIGNSLQTIVSAIISGVSNIMPSSGPQPHNLIVSGEFCSISPTNSVILSGKSNVLIGGNANNSIITGMGNTGGQRNHHVIGTGMSNINFNPSSIIFTGQNNRSDLNNGTLSNSYIGTGSNNSINIINYTNSGILSGSGNNCTNSNTVILTGQGNNLNVTRSFIGTGQSNNITSSTNGSIINSISSSITGVSSVNSSVGAGSSNSITASNCFAAGLGLTLSNAHSTAFGQYNLDGSLDGSNRIFMVGIGTDASLANRRNAFSVLANGVVRGLQFANGGADFAEYFESQTGQNLPLGYTVCMNQSQKIILSEETTNNVPIIGVIVNGSGYIGNMFEEDWRGKYERDIHGRMIYDDIMMEKIEDDFEIQEFEREIVEPVIHNSQNFYRKKVITERVKTSILASFDIFDVNGNSIRKEILPKKKKIIEIQKVPRLSVHYNPNLNYIPRSQRQEWNIVALLGQVWIKDNQRISPEWIKMSESINGYSKYFIQ